MADTTKNKQNKLKGKSEKKWVPDLMNNYPELGHIVSSFYTGQTLRRWHLLNWKALSK